MTYEQWDEWALRHEIVQIGQRLYQQFMIAGNDGNISARLGEDEILVTPTGVSKGFMAPEDMIKMTLDGKILYAKEGNVPSSEHRMHLLVYRRRPEIRGVVHAHPPTATGFAAAGVALDKEFLPEVVVRTGPTPLVPYAIPGGDELPRSLEPYIDNHVTLLMANHGVVAYAETLTEAMFNLETLELNARIYLTAHQLGRVNFLSEEEVNKLKARFDIPG